MYPRRLIVIGGTYVLAVFAAGAIMSLYYAVIFLGDVPRSEISATGLAVLLVMALGATCLWGVCAFLPASLVIAVCELWAIRQPVFYALLAALISVAVPLLPLFPGKGDVAGLMSWSSLISMIAGIAAGIVYWSHAGKDAGSANSKRWRDAPD